MLMMFFNISLTFDSCLIFLISSFWIAYFQIMNACSCTKCEFITNFLQSPFFFYIYSLWPLNNNSRLLENTLSIFPKNLSVNPLWDNILSYLVTFLHFKNFFIYSPILILTNLLIQYFFLSIAIKLHVLNELYVVLITFIANLFNEPSNFIAFFFFTATFVSGIVFNFSNSWTNFPVLVCKRRLKNFLDIYVTIILSLNFWIILTVWPF